MNKVKAGDLCILLGCINPSMKKYCGTVRTAVSLSTVYVDHWLLDPPVFGRNGTRGSWEASGLLPIRDQPGNESWFTAAPKSLPATTKGDTITERGELA